MNRKLILVLALVLIIALSGCAQLNIFPNQETITVTDDMGREVILSTTPARIISIAPSNTEFLFALGLSEKIVGVTDFCNYPADAAAKERVGDFANPSVEKIIGLKPDLVVAASLHQEVVEQLDQLNIPVIVIDAKNIQHILDSVDMLGMATGANEAAETLTKQITDDLELVDSKVMTLSEDEKPLVYFEVWNDPIMTAGPNTFIHELITRAGGVNIAADAPTDYPVYALEDLIARQPEVMIYTHGAETAEQIKDRQNWETIHALKYGRIYLVEEDLVLRPGPRIAKGLIELSKRLHPDIWE